MEVVRLIDLRRARAALSLLVEVFEDGFEFLDKALQMRLFLEMSGLCVTSAAVSQMGPFRQAHFLDFQLYRLACLIFKGLLLLLLLLLFFFYVTF